MRVAEVECSRPPDVVNTTWYEDKKSLRTRRVIYQCLPRYRLVSGQLWKVCGPRGNWTGRDPVCEGSYDTIVLHPRGSHVRNGDVYLLNCTLLLELRAAGSWQQPLLLCSAFIPPTFLNSTSRSPKRVGVFPFDCFLGVSPR